MQFIDTATIIVHAGSGGNGRVAFRREKYIAQGGPDGGDGGRGGSVFVIGATKLNGLLDYKYHSVYKAEDGQAGGGGKKHGQDGKNLKLPVPLGTLIYNRATQELIGEITGKEELLVARGGQGGIGNHRFKSSINRSPRESTNGETGEERTLNLELRLLADVAFIGLPNSGKSSLLRALTGAHSKIGDYPFTTLAPQQGIAQQAIDTPSFMLVDLPGVIMESSSGKGLGAGFLKHALRARLLFFILDGMDEDILQTIRTIEEEMRLFSHQLLKKPRWLIGNKLDLLDSAALSKRKKRLSQAGLPVFWVSAVTRQGLDKLMEQLNLFFMSKEEPS